MGEVALTKGKVTIVDNADLALLAGHRWVAKWTRDRWYDGRWVGARKGPRRFVWLHRVLLGLDGTVDPEVDHRNGDTLDNRRENLRRASRQQNRQNSKGWSKAGLKGVYRVPRDLARPYQAHIQDDRGRKRHLGYFATARAAALAYDAAARATFGEFARLNFPTPEHDTGPASVADLRTPPASEG